MDYLVSISDLLIGESAAAGCAGFVIRVVVCGRDEIFTDFLTVLAVAVGGGGDELWAWSFKLCGDCWLDNSFIESFWFNFYVLVLGFSNVENFLIAGCCGVVGGLMANSFFKIDLSAGFGFSVFRSSLTNLFSSRQLTFLRTSFCF